MRRPIILLLGFIVLGTTASVSHAGVPSPAESTFPHHILLVGTDAAGVADPAGTLTFHIVHFGGRPYGNPLIVIDFSQCPGIELCTTQADPQVLVDCPTRTARFFGNGSGDATVRITGRVDRTVAGSHAPNCILYSDGVMLGTFPAASPDEDGNGLGASDNSLWQQDYFSGQYWERSDFDGNGVLGAADLALWTTLFFANGSTRSCGAATCP